MKEKTTYIISSIDHMLRNWITYIVPALTDPTFTTSVSVALTAGIVGCLALYYVTMATMDDECDPEDYINRSIHARKRPPTC